MVVEPFLYNQGDSVNPSKETTNPSSVRMAMEETDILSTGMEEKGDEY